MRPPVAVPLDLSTRPVTFVVGERTLVVAKLAEGRWTVTVDGRLLDGTFDTQADAWQAGVREAARLDAGR